MIDAGKGCEGDICSGQRAMMRRERQPVRGASRTIEPSVGKPQRYKATGVKGGKGSVCFRQETVLLGW